VYVLTAASILVYVNLDVMDGKQVIALSALGQQRKHCLCQQLLDQQSLLLDSLTVGSRAPPLLEHSSSGSSNCPRTMSATPAVTTAHPLAVAVVHARQCTQSLQQLLACARLQLSRLHTPWLWP